MPDFGVSSLVGMMDGVKVLAFAVKEGKVAVHCHAGLGRTGVCIFLENPVLSTSIVFIVHLI
jgi:protein tyrosine phosphatase domain-containing protein 1